MGIDPVAGAPSPLGLGTVPDGARPGSSTTDTAKGPVAAANETQDAASHERLLDAARDFESLLVNMLMKAMRASIPRSDLFGDSNGLRTYEELRDEEFAKLMSRRGGLGLAPALVKQLEAAGQGALEELNSGRTALEAAERSYQAYGELSAGGGIPTPIPGVGPAGLPGRIGPLEDSGDQSSDDLLDESLEKPSESSLENLEENPPEKPLQEESTQ